MATLTPEEKRRAVEYLVHEIFIPQHNRRLAVFLVKYTEAVRRSLTLSIQTGMPIQLPPVHFDIRDACENLVDNLVGVEILTKNDAKEPPKTET